MSANDGLRRAEEKMRAAGQHEEAVRAFARAYERLVGGESALIGSDELEPVAGAPSSRSWTRAPRGRSTRWQ